MKRIVLVQAVGCVESGARVVLKELLTKVPDKLDMLVLCSSHVAREVVGGNFGKVGANAYVVGLPHRFFGRWLRVPLEIMIALAAVTRILRRVVNLSHYGLCWGGDYVLYIHNLLLMDMKQPQGWSQGRPNALNRFMLNTCVRRSTMLVLQTNYTASQLKAYCAAHGLPLPRHRIVRPKVGTIRHKSEVRQIPAPDRRFSFQLFYPTSRFSHKRINLAMSAARLVHNEDVDVGLIITVDGCEGTAACNDGVHCIGVVTRQEIFALYATVDALLFTSELESLGLPIVEAIEFGLPVIAPRLPYAVELLGDAGCYFDGDTPDAVVRAVCECRKNFGIYKERIARRSDEFRKEALTWEEHWPVLLGEA